MIIKLSDINAILVRSTSTANPLWKWSPSLVMKLLRTTQTYIWNEFWKQLYRVILSQHNLLHRAVFAEEFRISFRRPCEKLLPHEEKTQPTEHFDILRAVTLFQINLSVYQTNTWNIIYRLSKIEIHGYSLTRVTNQTERERNSKSTTGKRSPKLKPILNKYLSSMRPRIKLWNISFCIRKFSNLRVWEFLASWQIWT